MKFKSPLIILASASPIRLQILQAHGFNVTVMPADIEEKLIPGESARDYVTRLAKEKAQAILQRSDLPVADVIIAADTTVVCNDQILEKPLNAEHALSMLRLLSGNTHDVFTGFTLIFLKDRQAATGCSQTVIDFHELNHAQIKDYIDSGDPFDKAGSYGIQTVRDTFVKRMNGSYFNVMGLPIEDIINVLRQHIQI